MGRGWLSPKGLGLYMSLILRPQISPKEAPKITILIAASVSEAIRRFTPCLALIKWPNDILVNDRKICGILTEMDAELDRVNFLIVGIGLNVNAQRQHLPRTATSILQETGSKFSRVELAKEILRQIEHFYLSFKKRGFRQILDKWEDYSAISGRWIRVVCHDRKIEGQVKGIADSGELVLRLDNGFLEQVYAGDVVMVR
jgi:BirA family biotin operon repressor/biotin-[acetyl-CoA-carboxylase] ligase